MAHKEPKQEAACSLGSEDLPVPYFRHFEPYSPVALALVCAWYLGLRCGPEPALRLPSASLISRLHFPSCYQYRSDCGPGIIMLFDPHRCADI